MEPRNKKDQDEITKTNIILTEMLDEQQKANLIIAEHSEKSDQLAASIINLTNSKITSSLASTKQIEHIIDKGIAEIKFIAMSQDKPVIKKFQILLFPEQDAKLFYRIVFGRWLVMLAVMLLITDFYKWSLHWSDNEMMINQQKLENQRIKKAWNYLYFRKDRGFRRLMDSIYKTSNGN